MIEYINNINAKYSGAEISTFIGEFDGYNKSLWGKNIDSYKIIEVSISDAIQFFKKHAQDMKRIKDIFNYEKALYSIEVLKTL